MVAEEMAMNNNYKAPPRMTEDSSYERWKKEVALWEIFTELKEEKRAAAICLSLSGRARDASLELPIEDLSAKDGVLRLITKLDSLFLKDIDQRTYIAYDNFEKFKRHYGMNITDYIIEFEKLNHKIQEFKIVLPDQVLAYRLLKNADIGPEKEQLARATLKKLTYNDMKAQLKKIYDDTMSSSNMYDNHTVKKEEDMTTCDTYYNNNRQGSFVPRSNFRGRVRGRGRDTNHFQKPNDNRWNKPQEKDTRKRNPLDSHGYISKCMVCKSIFHWAADCPDKNKKETTDSGDNVTLFTADIESCYIESFLSETINKAILDSGCIHTICGRKWLDCYVDSLSDGEARQIAYEKSEHKFRFGDGKIYQSNELVKIPANIGGKKVFIQTDVIDCPLPLLLSQNSMRKADTKIDFSSDKANMFGTEIDLTFTQSGHYFIPLIEENINVTLIQNISADTDKVAMKLHKQFSHPPSEKLLKLLHDADIHDSQLESKIKKIEEHCETCLKFRKAKPKPIVAFPLSKEFNESVAMDLKFCDTKPILHLIDHATRYSAASVVRSKHKETISAKFFEIWITYFGSPGQILSDNGGEFANDDFRIMGEKLNTIIRNSAAESPWSNGINERHNF